MNINFSKELNLDHAIGGFVARITSPKAIREQDKETGRYTYSFHTDGLLTNEDGSHQVNKDGIYQVLDICKWGNDCDLQWNIYIVIISDGEVYPVAEYLDNPNTMWVKEARHIVKSYFNGEELDTVELTPKPKVESKKRGFSKYMNRPVSQEHKTEPKKESKSEGKKKPEQKKKDEMKPSKTLQKAEKKMKKKSAGRSQEVKTLKEGEVRLMTFTGMIIGTYPIKRHNKKYIEIDTDKGTLRFSRETCRQVNVPEGKERYANKIEYKLKG